MRADGDVRKGVRIGSIVFCFHLGAKSPEVRAALHEPRASLKIASDTESGATEKSCWNIALRDVEGSMGLPLSKIEAEIWSQSGFAVGVLGELLLDGLREGSGAPCGSNRGVRRGNVFGKKGWMQ